MSDAYSNSSTEPPLNLFPNIFRRPSEQPNPNLAEDDSNNDKDKQISNNDSDVNGVESIFHLRNALFNPSVPTDGSVDILEQLLPPKSVFRTLFDTINKQPDEDDYSIRSSVIKDMYLNESKINHQKEDGSKLAFLSIYEKAFKSGNHHHSGKSKVKSRTDDTLNNTIEATADVDENGLPIQTLNNDVDSVFDLSNMDDYQRYLKLTEINEKIQKKYEETYNNDDINVLDVVPTIGMGQYVGNFDEDNIIKKTHKKHTPWFSKEWKRNIGKSNLAKQNEVNTLYLDSSSNESYGPDGRRTLQRKLKVRHLQMISLGGTLGVGLYLNAGKAITIAGGFGSLLAFIFVGFVVLATIVSFSEMVTFISVVDGVSGLSSRFVDESFGFAIGWLYFISFSLGLAGEIIASVIMLSYFLDLKITEEKGSSAGFVTLFLGLILISNLIDVSIFGEIEYISSLIKLLFTLGMIITLIILNTGHWSSEPIGFKYWDYSKSDFDRNIIFGLFRPTFNLHDNGMSGNTSGIGGAKGRFLSLLVAIVSTSYAYSGTEIVCIAACEAKNPRKALPSATRRVFWRILIFYCLSIFVVSLNVYAGDPRLLRYFLGQSSVSTNDLSSNFAINYVGGNNCGSSGTSVYAGYGSGSQSPWIVAFQSVKLCGFSSVVNAFLVIFAVSCGNAQLYVSSRTVYSLALQKKAPYFLTYCSKRGIPYYLVLFSGAFGLLAYLCVNEKATAVFQNMTSVISSAGISVWFAMCLSFIRFYFGLKKRPDIISREDKSYPYRSKFQPYTAIFGLFGSFTILILMGYVVFLKGNWDTLFFFLSYGTFFAFIILYFGHKWIMGTRIPSLETLDFDTGRREIDRYIWDGGREYSVKNIKEITHKWLSFLA